MRSILPLLAFGLAVTVPAAAAEVVPVAAFRAVQLEGGGRVVIRPGAAQRVTIVNGSSRFTTITVKPRGKLSIEACNRACPRHYELDIVVETPRVPDLAIDGGGSIRAIPGFAAQNRITAAVHGGGVIDVQAVPANDVTAAVVGGGIISARPRNLLTAAVSGGGTIRYSGNPKVTSAINGGGAVRPIR